MPSLQVNVSISKIFLFSDSETDHPVNEHASMLGDSLQSQRSSSERGGSTHSLPAGWVKRIQQKHAQISKSLLYTGQKLYTQELIESYLSVNPSIIYKVHAN